MRAHIYDGEWVEKDIIKREMEFIFSYLFFKFFKLL